MPYQATYKVIQQIEGPSITFATTTHQLQTRLPQKIYVRRLASLIAQLPANS